MKRYNPSYNGNGDPAMAESPNGKYYSRADIIAAGCLVPVPIEQPAGATGCEHDWYITPDGLGWVAWNEMEFPIETPNNSFHPSDCQPVRLVPLEDAQ